MAASASRLLASSVFSKCFRHSENQKDTQIGTKMFDDRGLLDGPDAEHAKEIIAQCYRHANSGDRLGLALVLLGREPGAVFWTVLCEIWPSSDNTWNYHAQLLSMMARHAQTRRRYVPVEKQPSDDLPNFIKVWRGCSRERICGLAWTLDKKVAHGFARGHRCIKVPNPVFVSAEIPKTGIYFVENDRNESEVVLDPKKLRSIVTNDV